MLQSVTLPAAAIAGLLSFLSPCVLPLVPPYLTFLAGTTIEEAASHREARARRDIFLTAVLFVLGFSTVFVGLGATASSFGQLLHQYSSALSVLAGIAVVVMGLHFLGAFRFALFYREARVDVPRPAGLWGSYIMGLAFGFGWTPCIGPILAAILAVAASQQTVAKGIILLVFYSAGLGVPFLLTALAFEPFVRISKRFRAYLGAIERVIGALLVATGIGFLTGSIQDVSAWLLQTFPAFANLG